MKTLTPKNESGKQKSGEITRFLQFLNTRGLSVREVAEITGVAERTINNAVYTDSPLGGKLLRELHLNLGVSVDWLLSGTGLMLAAETQIAEPTADYSMKKLRTARLAAFIEDWSRTRGEEEQVWLEVQFKRAVPEYEAFSATFRP